MFNCREALFLVGAIHLFIILQLSFVQAGAPIIRLKLHSTAYSRPIAIVDANDSTKRLFVANRDGVINIVDRSTGIVESVPFLDVSSLLGDCEGYCEERGLLGLAFHPDYSSNGYFYINYTTQDAEGTLYSIVARFTTSDSDPNIADVESQVILLQFEQPYSNHNGGDLQFGPNDGYLYIASGDGGYFGDPQNYGQSLSTFLGKILRIDVDTFTNSTNYDIPSNNPWYGSHSYGNGTILPEIWSYGLRNPWRISFDSKTGEFYIADVGQNLWEEVNVQPADSTGGENYGWRLLEGNHCYNPSENCVDETDDSLVNLTYPVLEYEHVEGACSVTGGYVYRGQKKKLRGYYYYADYCNGNIWAARKRGGNWTTAIVKKAENMFISTFGQDTKGNLYIADLGSGSIYKIKHCKRNQEFRYKGQAKKSCKWVGKNAKRAERLCKKTTVYNACKVTCGNPTC